MTFYGYFHEMTRLWSFNDWPLTCTSGILLAKEGVYCLRSDGQGICAFCHKLTDFRKENIHLFRIIPGLTLHYDGCSCPKDKRNIPIVNSIQGNSHPQDGDRKYRKEIFLGVRLEGIIALQEIYGHPGDDERIVQAFQKTLEEKDGKWPYKDIVDILESNKPFSL